MAKSCECRQEFEKVYPMANGRLVRVILRNSLVPEDPFLVLAREKALTVRTGETFSASPTTRTIKDSLIKTNITI